MRVSWSKTQASLVLAVFVTFIASLRLGLSIDSLIFFNFQARDLERATQVAHGQWIFWGPELTGGGNLPGGFYYWLLSLPLRWGFGWKACWWLLACLSAAGYGLAAFFLANSFGLAAGLIASLFFSLPVAVHLDFLNVSALPFFLFASLAALVFSFSATEERKRAQAWWIVGFTSALGTQLHFSELLIFASGLLLQLLAPFLRLPRLSAKNFCIGCVLHFLLYFPYLLQGILSSRGQFFGLPVPLSSGQTAAAIPSLLHLAENPWATINAVDIALKLVVLVPLPLLCGLVTNVFFPAQPKLEREEKAKRVLLLVLLVSFFPAGYFFLRPNGVRYVLPFEAAFLGLLALVYRDATATETRAKFFAAFCTGSLFLLFFLGKPELSFHSLSFEWPRFLALALSAWLMLRYQGFRQALAFFAAGGLLLLQTAFWYPKSIKLPMLHYRELAMMSERVFESTGWSYSQARGRLFFVDKQISITPRFFYEDVMKERSPLQASEQPGGFLVAIQPDLFLVQEDKAAFVHWLLEQPLQEDIKRGLRTGSLELGDLYHQGLLAMVPYKVKNKNSLPTSFGNIGFAYESDPVNRILLGKRGSGVAKNSESDLLFYWNDCPDPWCTTGVHLSFQPRKERLLVKALIMGAPLEQPSEWTGPGWTQAWIAPYLEWECADGPQRELLAESVGINPKHSQSVSGMRQAYNSILAPVERSLELKCRGRLRSLSIGRESTLLYGVDGIRILKPSAISFQR